VRSALEGSIARRSGAGERNVRHLTSGPEGGVASYPQVIPATEQEAHGAIVDALRCSVREEVNPVDEGARKVVQVALGSWAMTLRLCVIIIVVVAAAIVLIPNFPVLD
jgi:hypothetical protein